MSHPWQHAAQKAAEIWRRAHMAIAMTGAGISVPSGIPDFRSPGGLWTKYDPNDVATFGALRTRPKRVWEFLLAADKLMGTAKANPGHKALARIEQAGLLTAVLTQNIDGLHQAGGSQRVVEFHGSARRFYCMSCKLDHDPEAIASLTQDDIPWTCECGGVIRPDFVFFGEHIPAAALSESLDLAARADVAVVVGTSGTVAPFNTLPHRVKANGGSVIEVNLHASEYGSLADVVVQGPAEDILPYVADLLEA
ncbi:MAG: NAD-dependent protein deacylase [Desulfovibrio sp.]|nr:MAG: NAD-dependent protein deacylase [Desulfovibrio sp.]